MNKREFKNRCDVVTRLLSVLIDSLSNQIYLSYFKNAVQFQFLSLNSFRYFISIIKYIYVVYIILEIFSCEFLKRHCVY